MLIVSFKHAGQQIQEQGEVDSELPQFKGMKERAELLPVRLRVAVDGEIVLEQVFEPRGVHHNSASVGSCEIPMQPGMHRVEVWIGDSADANEWTYKGSWETEFENSHRRVVQFDTEHGFEWD